MPAWQAPPWPGAGLRSYAVLAGDEGSARCAGAAWRRRGSAAARRATAASTTAMAAKACP
ncbi:UNVERIFIED_ORG: hypothetical protein FHR35_001262 [Microbispora rosea subsp. rosea]